MCNKERGREGEGGRDPISILILIFNGTNNMHLLFSYLFSMFPLLCRLSPLCFVFRG
jgi:hypothetical protein